METSLEISYINMVKPLFGYITKIDSRNNFICFKVPPNVRVNPDTALQFFMNDLTLNCSKNMFDEYEREISGTISDQGLFNRIYTEYLKADQFE